MHVCLDYRPALHEGTGVGTYVRGLLRGLLQAFPDDRYTAFSASLSHRVVRPPGLQDARFVDARFPVRVLDWLWHRRGWPPVEHWVGALDIAHSPSPMLLPSGAARVITVHDCHFLRHPEDVVGPVKRDYGPLLRRAVAGADAVMTVSETTRQELCELLDVPPDKVHVAHLAVEPEFIEQALAPAQERQARIQAMRARLALEGPYLLFVGRREPRKDLGTLLAAFELVLREVPDMQLLLVGPDGHKWDATWDASPAAARARTRLIPHQHGADLAALYDDAMALVLSSRWEGFGLTPLEAMAMGTPVAATRAGALPEILGDAAVWAEPGDADGLAKGCLRLLRDSEQHASFGAAGRQRAERYDWRRTAEATHAVYRQLGDAR